MTELELTDLKQPIISPELREQITAAFGLARKVSLSEQRMLATSKYLSEPNELIMGQPKDAARGINWYLGIDDERAYEALTHSLESLKREFADFGTAEDQECLRYVLHEKAGSSAREFANGVRDQGRNGETIQDFVDHPNAARSGLSFAQVVALRLYTTAAFKSLNGPLRDFERIAPHRFPVTIILIKEAIGRLRTVGAEDQVEGEVVLWRGMRNLAVTDDFIHNGGTEVAPMSTTSDINVALEYSCSHSSLLFKIVTNSFMERGVDLSWVSAFPGESEYLYPPLTYLRPTPSTAETISIPGHSDTITIVEVTPYFGS